MSVAIEIKRDALRSRLASPPLVNNLDLKSENKEDKNNHAGNKQFRKAIYDKNNSKSNVKNNVILNNIDTTHEQQSISHEQQNITGHNKIKSDYNFSNSNSYSSNIKSEQNKQNQVHNEFAKDVNIKRKILREHLVAQERRKTDFAIVNGTLKDNLKDSFKQKSYNIKYVSKDIENFARSTANTNDDNIGNGSLDMSIDIMRTTIRANNKLTAVNMNIPSQAILCGKNTIKAGENIYKVSDNIHKDLKIKGIKGTFNSYKGLAIQKASNTIKYSSIANKIYNTKDNVKTVYYKTSLGYSTTVNFVKGVKQGNIKNLPNDFFAWSKKSIKDTTVNSVNKGKEIVARVSESKVLNSSIDRTNNVVNNITKDSDDMGSQALGTTSNSLKYSYKITKDIIKASSSASKNVVKTSKGTIQFAKDIKNMGTKKATKFWYKAHVKGAGKKVTDKILTKIFMVLKKMFFSPPVLIAIAIILCTIVVGNTAIISATSVVGGVVEFFEELADGIKEVWDNVTDAISDFLDNCVGWLKSLFGYEEDIGVDIDIGDDMSICEYLLGVVQLYKAEFNIKTQDRYDTLIEDEGYHGAMFYNLFGDDIEIHDISDPDKGLMSDINYVKAILPVWKAIVLGTIGTEFSGKQANEIAKECFDVLTEKIEVPYIDLDSDGVADYSYCDGSFSLHEGENKVYTHIGGVIQDGIHSDTGWCYNNSGTLYHTSHNTEGLSCCLTNYWCGGHDSCNGHLVCNGHKKNGVTTYCDGCTVEYCDGCSNTYCYDGTKTSSQGCSNEQSSFTCSGYNMCLGHKIMKFFIGSYNFDDLLNEKFVNRINELETKDVLSKEEKEELSNLQMYYEYALGCNDFSDPIADEFFENQNKGEIK